MTIFVSLRRYKTSLGLLFALVLCLSLTSCRNYFFPKIYNDSEFTANQPPFTAGIKPRQNRVPSHYRLIDVVATQRRIVRNIPKVISRDPRGTPPNIAMVEALEDALLGEMKGADPEPRPFWEKVSKLAIPQLGIPSQTTPSKILDNIEKKTLADKSLHQPQNLDLRQKIIEDLDHLDANVNLNILEHPEEATFIIADKAISHPQKIGRVNDFGIEISPKDLLRSIAGTCQQDLCQVKVVKPMAISRTVPININFFIDIVFTQAINPKTRLMTFDIAIDGHYKPVNFGEIVAVDLSAGLDLHYAPDTQALSIDNLRCNARLDCNIPFLRFTTKISDQGISFDTGLGLEGIGGQLVKILPNGGQVAKKLSFDQVFAGLKKAISNLPAPDEPVDLLWEDILSEKNAETLRVGTPQKPTIEVY